MYVCLFVCCLCVVCRGVSDSVSSEGTWWTGASGLTAQGDGQEGPAVCRHWCRLEVQQECSQCHTVSGRGNMTVNGWGNLTVSVSGKKTTTTVIG